MNSYSEQRISKCNKNIENEQYRNGSYPLHDDTLL